MLSPKTNIFKEMCKNKCFCFYEITRLIIMRLKMKIGSHRYDINRTSPRHGHKYTRYKMYLSMMTVNLCAISNAQATLKAEFME